MSGTQDEYLHHVIGSALVSFDAGHLGVAVSGGGDSMAVLLLMADWAGAQGARLSAVTVDHGLRPEAAEEAAMVAAFCAERGIAHAVLRWQGWDGKGNLQGEARAARYRLIAEWAQAQGVEAVCLGHTRDDQAETVLMRLARKAGSYGLRGMAGDFERHGLRWLRPALGVRRAALRAYLRRQGVAWVEDPSNEDARFDRIKARRVLEALAPLGIDADTLGAVAENLGRENALIRETVHKVLRGQVEARCGALSCDAAFFAALHPEVRRRFLMAAAQWIGGAAYTPRNSAVREMAAALRQGDAHTLGGIIGWVSKGRIWLAREYAPARAARGTPFDGRWQITGTETGQEIRALGPKGLQQLADWRELGLPRRVLLPLPGVWAGENLCAAPVMGTRYGTRCGANRVKASDLRPSFDNWLMQH